MRQRGADFRHEFRHVAAPARRRHRLAGGRVDRRDLLAFAVARPLFQVDVVDEQASVAARNVCAGFGYPVVTERGIGDVARELRTAAA